MKSKNIDISKQIKKFQRNIKNLSLDVKAIIEEHDRYTLNGSKEEVEKWFHSLPIESLKESLNREYGRPRTRYTLHDMKHKFALRKLYEQKQDALVEEQRKLNIAKIDYILLQIERIQNGENIRGN
jgi:hypothetical protein